MKYISLILIILFCSCQAKINEKEINSINSKPKSSKEANLAENDFDEILHFTVSGEVVKKNELNQKFQDEYSNLEDKKNDINNYENKILGLGFTYKSIEKNKIQKIVYTVTNDLNLKYNEVACVPYYNDIFIFKKNKKPIAALKVCFHCGMNETIGKINSNFDTENHKIFSDYSVLYKLIYNKEYDQTKL